MRSKFEGKEFYARQIEPIVDGNLLLALDGLEEPNFDPVYCNILGNNRDNINLYVETFAGEKFHGFVIGSGFLYYVNKPVYNHSFMVHIVEILKWKPH